MDNISKIINIKKFINKEIIPINKNFTNTETFFNFIKLYEILLDKNFDKYINNYINLYKTKRNYEIFLVNFIKEYKQQKKKDDIVTKSIILFLEGIYEKYQKITNIKEEISQNICIFTKYIENSNIINNIKGLNYIDSDLNKNIHIKINISDIKFIIQIPLFFYNDKKNIIITLTDKFDNIININKDPPYIKTLSDIQIIKQYFYFVYKVNKNDETWTSLLINKDYNNIQLPVTIDDIQKSIYLKNLIETNDFFIDNNNNTTETSNYIGHIILDTNNEFNKLENIKEDYKYIYCIKNIYEQFFINIFLPPSYTYKDTFLNIFYV